MRRGVWAGGGAYRAKEQRVWNGGALGAVPKIAVAETTAGLGVGSLIVGNIALGFWRNAPVTRRGFLSFVCWNALIAAFVVLTVSPAYANRGVWTDNGGYQQTGSRGTWTDVGGMQENTGAAPTVQKQYTVPYLGAG